jgi:hypothetical protein
MTIYLSPYNGGGGGRWGQTTTLVMDNKGMQDWVADCNGEGMTLARDAGDSGVAKMVATVEDGGGR